MKHTGWVLCFENARISARTHVQWCIRDPRASVIAYFRPRQQIR
jgi:hypothetical protein